MTSDSPAKHAEVEARLQERRKDILALIEGHGEDGKPVELDQTRVGRLSRMDSLQSQAMAKETDRRRHQELDQIDNALQRLVDGTYGDCIDCGEPIADKRLAFDPSTPLCIDCASREER